MSNRPVLSAIHLHSCLGTYVGARTRPHLVVTRAGPAAPHPASHSPIPAWLCHPGGIFGIIPPPYTPEGHDDGIPDTGALLPLDKALQGMLEQLTCCCETEQLPCPRRWIRILAEGDKLPCRCPSTTTPPWTVYVVRLGGSCRRGAHSPWRAKAFAGQGKWPAGHSSAS